MSEEEKKAIEQVRLLLAGDISLYIEDDDGGTAYNGIVNKLYNDDLEKVLNLINKQQKELETYKKIAEKFALTILEIDVEEKDVYETICKSTPNNRCEEFGNGNCTQCIIDWARKEVEND